MTRDPASVPVQVIAQTADLPLLETALATAARVALDTETPIDGPERGRLRVMSIATRRHEDAHEQAFVVDVRDVDARLLGPILDGATAHAWNANFDARVVDAAVYASSDVTSGIGWWDCQLADALLHQGRSGFGWYHGLAWATEHYLGLTADGKGTTQLSYTAEDDLSAEQIRYAATDAVETLWVADALHRRIDQEGLATICEIEMAARPFLDRMERSGLPFDWVGWQAELERLEQQHRLVLGRLAELTGGGQGSLFDEVIEPTWNPASEKQVRIALNHWSQAEVRTWTASRYGQARALGDHDSVTAGVLREIGGEVCEALLEFRNLAKILSTYGESIHEHLDADGRLRPQYLQVVGTNTGRLASRNPNAQNFTPRMKPYLRPPEPSRVFVHADLSQAELRFLAQVAEDETLRAAFKRGEDVHVSTAATMFDFDPEELAASNPDRFKRLRQLAKALNFGIAYGTGAAALARSLTANGTPTSLDEGRHLLDQYRRTYPGTTAWAQRRIDEIDRVATRTSRIDWASTMRLARNYDEIATVRREFRRSRHRWPAVTEVADALAASGGRRVDVDLISWVVQFSAPVALVDEHEPFTFVSRTVAGRRQQFNLHLDRLLLVATIDAIRSPEPNLVAVRDRFARHHDLILYRRGELLDDDDLGRRFEDRSLRRLYVDAIATEAGEAVAHSFLARAARQRVRAMVNAWRNAPIQGGVADIMLEAYAGLHRSLGAFPSARPVQTVHDSVVVECDIAEADAVVEVVRQALEAASLRFCPDVRPQVDVDVRRSLDEADVVEPARIGA